MVILPVFKPILQVDHAVMAESQRYRVAFSEIFAATLTLLHGDDSSRLWIFFARD